MSMSKQHLSSGGRWRCPAVDDSDQVVYDFRVIFRLMRVIAPGAVFYDRTVMENIPGPAKTGMQEIHGAVAEQAVEFSAVSLMAGEIAALIIAVKVHRFPCMLFRHGFSIFSRSAFLHDYLLQHTVWRIAATEKTYEEKFFRNVAAGNCTCPAAKIEKNTTETKRVRGEGKEC